MLNWQAFEEILNNIFLKEIFDILWDIGLFSKIFQLFVKLFWEWHASEYR